MIYIYYYYSYNKRQFFARLNQGTTLLYLGVTVFRGRYIFCWYRLHFLHHVVVRPRERSFSSVRDEPCEWKCFQKRWVDADPCCCCCSQTTIDRLQHSICVLQNSATHAHRTKPHSNHRGGSPVVEYRHD